MKTHAIAIALAVGAIWAVSSAQAGNLNGRAGSMPAIYDGELFTVNFKEMPAKATASLLAHNGSVNVIYTSDDTLPDGSHFVAVLDAIQGDGFNPLWLEIEIKFNPGHTPHQLMSDDEVEEAFQSGEIDLDSELEVYRCSVIGPQS
jgi:hypothetical protein